jgi:hypothetical protein
MASARSFTTTTISSRPPFDRRIRSINASRMRRLLKYCVST